MSENFSVINLILGIIGTVTGIIALFISYWTLKKGSPHLEIRVLECEHDFTEEEKNISFWVDFQIKNLGDRGTSINDIDLTFKDNGKEYKLKKQSFREYSEEFFTGSKLSQRIWINPHETMDISADYWRPYEGKKQEQIDCTFTLYYTHGAEKNIKSISQKKKQSP